MSRLTSFVLAILALSGCSGMSEPCQELALSVCATCDVDDVTEGTVCSCLESGTVDDEEWFEDDNAATRWCFDLQNSLQQQYSTKEETLECEQMGRAAENWIWRVAVLREKWGDGSCHL